MIRNKWVRSPVHGIETARQMVGENNIYNSVLIVDDSSNEDAVKTYYGYTGNDFVTEMAVVEKFMDTTGLTGLELRELLFQNLSEQCQFYLTR